MDREMVIQELRNFQKDVGSQYGIISIGVFGSVAGNAVAEGSDVDVVVSLKRPNLFMLSRIRIELEERLHRHVDIVSYREHMNPFLKERIEQEALYV